MLTAAGASEEIAVAVVNVAQGAAAEHGRELATRADISELRTMLDAQREATRADIETLRETTRADIAELRAEQARAETRLIKWVVGTDPFAG